MVRLRRALVIATLSLLTSAATAYAECAWVLWIEFTRVGGAQRYNREWEAQLAVPTWEGCQSAAKQRTLNNVTLANDPVRSPGVKPGSVEVSEVVGGGYTVKMEYLGPNEGMTSLERFQCFPDTIKPK